MYSVIFEVEIADGKKRSIFKYSNSFKRAVS